MRRSIKQRVAAGDARKKKTYRRDTGDFLTDSCEEDDGVAESERTGRRGVFVVEGWR